jgi:hypothetical protein
VNRKLASPILTKRPDDQRPRRHHPLDQFRPNRRPARIAEIPKLSDHTHTDISLREMPHRFNLLGRADEIATAGRSIRHLRPMKAPPLFSRASHTGRRVDAADKADCIVLGVSQSME